MNTRWCNLYLHTRGAFGIARFDKQGNAKAFMKWNGRKSAPRFLFYVSSHTYTLPMEPGKLTNSTFTENGRIKLPEQWLTATAAATTSHRTNSTLQIKRIRNSRIRPRLARLTPMLGTNRRLDSMASRSRLLLHRSIQSTSRLSHSGSRDITSRYHPISCDIWHNSCRTLSKRITTFRTHCIKRRPQAKPVAFICWSTIRA